MFKDIRTIIRDLKVTLKITVKAVLKVHKIIDDVEETMNNLKSTVSLLSSKICEQKKETKINQQDQPISKYGGRTMPIDNILGSLETTACSVRDKVTTIMDDEGLSTCVDKWRRVLAESNAGEKIFKICPSVRKGIKLKLPERDIFYQEFQPRIQRICQSFDTIKAEIRMKPQNIASKNTNEIRIIAVKGTKVKRIVSQENVLKQVNNIFPWLTTVHLGKKKKSDEHCTTFSKRASCFNENAHSLVPFVKQSEAAEWLPSHAYGDVYLRHSTEIVPLVNYLAVYFVLIHKLLRWMEYYKEPYSSVGFHEQSKPTCAVTYLLDID